MVNVQQTSGMVNNERKLGVLVTRVIERVRRLCCSV
jgi:hypothetical protein